MRKRWEIRERVDKPNAAAGGARTEDFSSRTDRKRPSNTTDPAATMDPALKARPKEPRRIELAHVVAGERRTASSVELKKIGRNPCQLKAIAKLSERDATMSIGIICLPSRL
jgi:hypothetical protein